jgi:hypothetical protein
MAGEIIHKKDVASMKDIQHKKQLKNHQLFSNTNT